MEIINIEKEKNNIVKKHNDLIRAKGELSTTAQKMLAMIISMIRTDDTEFQRYALNIEEYKKLSNLSNNEINFYVKQAEELMRNPFKIDKKLFNWCSMVDYGSMEGFIIFDIHPDLRKYLLQLKENFTQYQLVNVLQLRGKYSLKLYEYITMEFNKVKKYKPKTKQIKIEININELREFLNLPKSYKYNHIKEQIIKKTQKDLENFTNIKFTFEESKIGKKVKSLVLTVKDNLSGSNDFLLDLKSFIKYMRINHVNDDILTVKDKNTGETLLLSVDLEGKLYDKFSVRQINSKRSKEMWETLYEFAKNNKLKCLKQGRLF